VNCQFNVFQPVTTLLYTLKEGKGGGRGEKEKDLFNMSTILGCL
jgi:hypothetical protein